MRVLRVFALVLFAVHLAWADDPFAQSSSLLSAAFQHQEASSVAPKTLAELEELAIDRKSVV